MEEAFRQLYFQGNTDKFRDYLDQLDQQTLGENMVKCIDQYLEKVYKDLSNLVVEDLPTAEHFVKETYNYWINLQNCAKEVSKFKEISNNFQIIEIHKVQFCNQILNDKTINEQFILLFKTYTSRMDPRILEMANYLNLLAVQKWNKQQNGSDIVDTQKPKITTHQELMNNWLTYSTYDDTGLDEIKEFEKRLDSAIAYLTDDQKQQPKVSQTWEKNIANQMKKKKNKYQV